MQVKYSLSKTVAMQVFLRSDRQAMVQHCSAHSVCLWNPVCCTSGVRQAAEDGPMEAGVENKVRRENQGMM